MSFPYKTSSRHVPKRPLSILLLCPTKYWRDTLFQFNTKISPSYRLLVSALALYATAFRPMFPWWWAHATTVFALDYHSHWTMTLTVRLFYRTGFSSADASYLLIPINRLLHVGLKPSIYGGDALLWTECTQPGDCLSNSSFQQM